MAVCVFCGTPLEDGTLICDICGSSQPEEPARRVPVKPAPPPPALAPVPATPAAQEKPHLLGPRLILFGPDKQPKQVFPLTKDATLIGRLDVVEGNFPDIDLRDCLDETAARKVSRSHVLILRQRASRSFVLRPLAGNSGTQLEAEMIPAGQDFPLAPGSRFVLGGVVRFKFEVS